MGSACSQQAEATKVAELTVVPDEAKAETKQEATLAHAEPAPPTAEAQSPKAPKEEEAGSAGEEAAGAEPQGLPAAAAHGVQQATAAVQERVEQAAEAAQGGAEAEAKTEAEADPPAVPASPAVVVEAKDAAQKVEAAEAVAPLMGAATAAATGATVVTLLFQAGREKKAVEFRSRDLGFVCMRAGGGCCIGGAARGRVLVGRVEPKKPAEKLGVKKGWVLTDVNGTAVTGLEQAEKLLQEVMARLPQVAP